MDNIRSTNVSASTGIDFNKISGDTNNDGIDDNGKGLYILSSTESDAYPIMYYRGNIDDNNVYFAGYCWQIIRTTDTGGIKMIYNGENTGTDDEPICNNSIGTDRQITLDINNVLTNTFTFATNGFYTSPTYNGYMYGEVYNINNSDYIEGAYFGNGFVYDEENYEYTLTDVQTELDENHHYTCNLSTANGTCESIRYYFNYNFGDSNGYHLFFLLTGGKSIEDAIEEMRENTTDSNVKAMVDLWYEENMSNTRYEELIEDTIYCNDRNIIKLGGLNSNSGLLNERVQYTSNKINASVKCFRKNDSFTKSSAKGNGKLDYSIGLIDVHEIIMAGGKYNVANGSYYLNTGANYWSMSPDSFTDVNARNFRVNSTGMYLSIITDKKAGIRPVISLKQGTSMISGTGTPTDPYVVE